MRIGKTENLAKALGVFSLIYMGLFFQRTRWEGGQLLFGWVNLLLQVWLDLVAIGCARKIGSRLFGIAFLFAAFTDLVYGLKLQVFGITHDMGTPLEWLVNGPYLLFQVFSLAALAKSNPKKSISAGVAVILFIGVLVGMGPSVMAKPWPFQTKFIHFACFMFESGLFGFGLGRGKIGIGFLIIASYGLLLQSMEIYSGLEVGLPIEFLWTSALLFIVSGLSRE